MRATSPDASCPLKYHIGPNPSCAGRMDHVNADHLAVIPPLRRDPPRCLESSCNQLLEVRIMAYAEDYASFRWDIPEHYNFGTDVVDRLAQDPSRLALRYMAADGAVEDYTFRDMAEGSDRIGHALAAAGVRRGESVLLVLPKLPIWHQAMVGVLKIGAVAIPCSEMLRERDLLYRANHSQATAIITTPELSPVVSAIAQRAPHLQSRFTTAPMEGFSDLSAAMAAAPPTSPAVRTRSDEPALCYYTSGTTGEPKAVLHLHRYPIGHRVTARYWIGLQDGDLFWSTSATGWAKAAWSVLFGPWELGVATFMYGGRFEPRRHLEILSSQPVTALCAPPTEFRLMVKEDLARYPMPSLRTAVAAGEPLNPEVIRLFQKETGITIRDGYGQTETVCIVANHPALAVRPGSMGLPTPGHDVRVLAEDGSELPPGEVGDVSIRDDAPSIFAGYWHAEEATRATRRGAYYITGDRATRDDDGYFWFVGRADDIIISAGYRIGPFEVESALIEHPAVLEAAVVASPDPDRGEIVKAFITLRSGAEPSDALVRELQEHCKRVTAPYKYPRAIEFVQELPKTTSGKIRRVELRQREWAKKDE